MSRQSKLPPLWSVPIMATKIPRMLWAQLRIGQSIMGSETIKTRAFEGYTPASHDVFVCTYSKSGTYWMLQIVTQIAGRDAHARPSGSRPRLPRGAGAPSRPS